MGILGRSERRATPAAIADFWAWWSSSGRASIGDALERASLHEVVPEIGARVNALQPGLAWHLSPGHTSTHAFTLSASGNPSLRPTAERWRRAAPGDTAWEFRSAQAADPAALENEVTLGTERFDLRQITFGMTDAGRRFDVTVAHPLFATVSPDLAHHLAFLALDWALGEDAIERWVAAVGVSSEPGASLGELQAAIATREASRDPGTWSMLSGQMSGKPVVAMVRSGMDRLDAPTHDLHHAVTVRFRANADGLPLDVASLQDTEEQFHDIAGALLVAVETHRGTRTLHLYTDSDDAAAGRAVEFAAKGAGRKVSANPDAGWDAIRHLMP